MIEHEERKMTHGEKKIAKIVEELTMYFFAAGAHHINSDIRVESNHAVITFGADYKLEERYRFERMEEYLNETKNEGIEDFYWELAGSGDPGETSQLLLIGMMIDKAEILVTDEEVSLVLYKELDESIE